MGTFQQLWQQLDGHDIKILEELTFLSKTRGYARPARTYLSNKLGVTIWTISRHTAKLARLGLLRIQHRRRQKSDGTWTFRTNVYQVLFKLRDRLRAIAELIAGKRKYSRVRFRAHKQTKESNFSYSFEKFGNNKEIRGILESWIQREPSCRPV